MLTDNINKLTKYPLLVLKKGDNNIYAFKSDFGIVSKGGEKFYKNLTIINSNGEVYHSIDARVLGNAKIFYYLKYFQKMYQVEVIYDKKIDYITLEDLKIKIIQFIKKSPKKWLALDTIEEIQKMIEKTNSYKELILIFE